MKVGIIGTGAIGKAFTKQLMNTDIEVIISNSRGEEFLESMAEAFNNFTAGPVTDAARADIVFPGLQ